MSENRIDSSTSGASTGRSIADQSGVVFVVDDDEEVRDLIADLLRSRGLSVRVYGTVQEFLCEPPSKLPACVVLDVHLPDGTGLEIQRAFLQQGRNVPILFITGQRDVATAVRAMKAGAIEFLLKPVPFDELLGAVKEALAISRAHCETLARNAELQRRYQLLTRREREVFRLVVTGMLNKQIAHELGISEVTVKIHRRQVMSKMAAECVADLVRMAQHFETKSALGPRSENET